MSEWRRIWAKAIRANQKMCMNLEEGEKSFAELLRKHPDDGMILYSRGEGYERLRMWAQALSDYSEAARLMPAPHWKDVARAAADRVRCEMTNLRTPAASLVWTAFHRVYGAYRAPHRVRVEALSAITRFDSESASAAASLRNCLQEVVRELLGRFGADVAIRDDKELVKQIEWLSENGKVSSDVGALMGRVRRIGNKATHGKGAEFEAVLRDFPEILEQIGWHVKTPRP